jgi:heat shock protein HslJ
MKYLVNNTAMSYKFITGLVLKKQSAMAIEEDKLEALKKDFQFKSLTEHKLVVVTENKPKSLISAAEEIAEKDAEIAKLKAELAKANGKLEYAEASGKDVDKEIDTESTIEIDEEQPTEEEKPTTKKKTSKK